MSSVNEFFSEYNDKLQIYVRDKKTKNIEIIRNDVYSKEERDEFTAQYECLDDNCESPIYLYSKTKESFKQQRRAHYKHKNNEIEDTINTKSESLKHQAGKELIHNFLYQYIEEYYDDGDIPLEKEKLLPSPNRKPDVFLDDENIRFSFEIEYKYTDKDYIKNKNKDLLQHDSLCQWIVGHTKVEYENKNKSIYVLDENCKEILNEQNHLIFINPFTEEIGTALYYNSNTPMAYWKNNPDILRSVEIENIDNCLFSYYTGIVTSPLQEILGIDNKDDLYRLDRKWEDHELFNDFLDDFPPYLHLIHKDSYLFDCLPLQWHYRIYYELIKGKEVGETFTSKDVDKSLKKENISNNENLFHGYIHFLNFLADKGFIYQYKPYQWVVIDSSLGREEIPEKLKIINTINVNEWVAYHLLTTGENAEGMGCSQRHLESIAKEHLENNKSFNNNGKTFEVNICNAYSMRNTFTAGYGYRKEASFDAELYSGHKQDYSLVLVRLHQNIQHVTLFKGMDPYMVSWFDEYEGDYHYEIRGIEKIGSYIYPIKIIHDDDDIYNVCCGICIHKEES